MDPMGRMLLEHAYEAIVDAGVNPAHLKGTNTGVFVGACFSESEISWVYQKLEVNVSFLLSLSIYNSAMEFNIPSFISSILMGKCLVRNPIFMLYRERALVLPDVAEVYWATDCLVGWR